MTVGDLRRRRGRLVDRLLGTRWRRGGTPDSRCLLRVLGRTNGTLHSTPILPLANGGRRWLVAESDTAAWVSNARANHWAILSWGKTDERDELVELVELGPHQTPPILRDLARRMPGHRLVTAADPERRPETCAGDASAHPVFEVIGGDRARGGGR